MTWDFPEVNPFSGAAGDIGVSITGVIKGIPAISNAKAGFSNQSDAATQNISKEKIISTDPPYYDNIGYADLSDFFYVWLRRSIRPIYPNIFASMTVPKSEELIASPYRHGDRSQAESFFMNGMTAAIRFKPITSSNDLLCIQAGRQCCINRVGDIPGSCFKIRVCNNRDMAITYGNG